MTDRSGKKLPQLDYSRPPGKQADAIPALTWESAPAGMTYAEESLGSWQGRKILISYYHDRNEGGGPVVNYVTEVLSCQDSSGIMRPFMVLDNGPGGLNGVSIKRLPAPAGRQRNSPPRIEVRQSSRHDRTGAIFTFLHGRPVLIQRTDSGRLPPDTRRDYDVSGNLLSVRLDWNPE